jgi:hypothetical protein
MRLTSTSPSPSNVVHLGLGGAGDQGKNEKDRSGVFGTNGSKFLPPPRTTRLDRCGGDKSLEARRREPRTHSFRHQSALRRFQRDPAPRSGRPAIKNMIQSKRIDEFGAGRAALRKVLPDSKHHIARSKRWFPLLQARKRHSSREPRLAWARHAPKER